jgi:lysophospholipase L1-like esterase
MTDEDIQRNLQSMSELAKANNIKVVLASITPTSAYHTPERGVPQTAARPMARIRALNDWMKQYAAANGHVYLDYFSAMVDQAGVMKAELTADDLHPNAAGYAIMGPLAEAAIQRALR